VMGMGGGERLSILSVDHPLGGIQSGRARGGTVEDPSHPLGLPPVRKGIVSFPTHATFGWNGKGFVVRRVHPVVSTPSPLRFPKTRPSFVHRTATTPRMRNMHAHARPSRSHGLVETKKKGWKSGRRGGEKERNEHEETHTHGRSQALIMVEGNCIQPIQTSEPTNQRESCVAKPNGARKNTHTNARLTTERTWARRTKWWCRRDTPTPLGRRSV